MQEGSRPTATAITQDPASGLYGVAVINPYPDQHQSKMLETLHDFGDVAELVMARNNAIGFAYYRTKAEAHACWQSLKDNRKWKAKPAFPRNKSRPNTSQTAGHYSVAAPVQNSGFGRQSGRRQNRAPSGPSPPPRRESISDDDIGFVFRRKHAEAPEVLTTSDLVKLGPAFQAISDHNKIPEMVKQEEDERTGDEDGASSISPVCTDITDRNEMTSKIMECLEETLLFMFEADTDSGPDNPPAQLEGDKHASSTSKSQKLKKKGKKGKSHSGTTCSSDESQEEGDVRPMPHPRFGRRLTERERDQAIEYIRKPPVHKHRFFYRTDLVGLKNKIELGLTAVRVVIFNIPIDAHIGHIINLCASFAQPLYIDIQTPWKVGKPSYAIVTVRTEEDAENMIEGLHRTRMGSKLLLVMAEKDFLDGVLVDYLYQRYTSQNNGERPNL